MNNNINNRYQAAAIRKEATHYLPQPSPNAMPTYYKKGVVQFNDGTTGESLCYLTYCGAWHGTNHRNREELIKLLVPIDFNDPVVIGTLKMLDNNSN